MVDPPVLSSSSSSSLRPWINIIIVQFPPCCTHRPELFERHPDLVAPESLCRVRPRSGNVARVWTRFYARTSFPWNLLCPYGLRKMTVLSSAETAEQPPRKKLCLSASRQFQSKSYARSQLNPMASPLDQPGNWSLQFFRSSFVNFKV